MTERSAELKERPKLATTDSLYRISVSDSSGERIAEQTQTRAKKAAVKIPTSYINPVIQMAKSSMSSKSSSVRTDKGAKADKHIRTELTASVKRDKVVETKIENFDIDECFPDLIPEMEKPIVVPLDRSASEWALQVYKRVFLMWIYFVFFGSTFWTKFNYKKVLRMFFSLHFGI